MPTLSLVPPHPYDLARTARAVGLRSAGADGVLWYASTTPDGPGTMAVRSLAGRLEVEAWGPGGCRLLEGAERLLGLDDRPGAFSPGGGLMRDLHRRGMGLHLGSTSRVYEAIVPAVIGQLVTTREAMAAFRALVRTMGEQAPGPNEAIRLLPPAAALAQMTYADLHPLGIERKRADVLIECARRARRLEEAVAMSPEDARRRLQAVRGVGPWTAETVMGVAYGDRDAVPPGDHNLPHTVAFALAGEPRGTDDRMFELLAPFRPYRRRALVLLKQSGIRAPRYGPRAPLRTHL